MRVGDGEWGMFISHHKFTLLEKIKHGLFLLLER